MVGPRYCAVHSFAAMIEGWFERDPGGCLGFGGCSGGVDLSSM